MIHNLLENFLDILQDPTIMEEKDRRIKLKEFNLNHQE